MDRTEANTSCHYGDNELQEDGQADRNDEHWDINIFKKIHQSQEGNMHQQGNQYDGEQPQNGATLGEEGEEAGHEGKNINHHTDVLDEQDVNNFLENERMASSQGGDAAIESKYIPQQGMEFQSALEAHKYFNQYAGMAGFAAIIAHQARTQSRKRKNEVIRVTYKCNRQGKQDTYKEGNTQEEVITERDTNVLVKTNCKCCMVVSERKGVWVVTRLDLEHNHPMDPGAKYFRAHKNMTDQEKKLIRTLNECNIPPKKMMYFLSFLRGGLGPTPYRDKDISNYRSKINNSQITPAARVAPPANAPATPLPPPAPLAPAAPLPPPPTSLAPAAPLPPPAALSDRSDRSASFTTSLDGTDVASAHNEAQSAHSNQDFVQGASGGRKRKQSHIGSAIEDFGQFKKTQISKTIDALNEKRKKVEDFSVDKCLDEVDAMDGLTDVEKSYGMDIFKSEIDREVFMKMRNKNVRFIWLKRQISVLSGGNVGGRNV